MKLFRTISAEVRPPSAPADHDRSAKNDVDVLIIGAGPAGSVAALSLLGPQAVRRTNQGSPRVLVVDREEFPRGKVCGCCLNGAAVGVFDALQLSLLPAELGAVPLHRWQAQIAGRRTEVSLPMGWALSREALDATLLDHVRHRGAEVRTGVVARIRESDPAGAWVELKQASGVTVTVRAGCVVVASGLAGGGLDEVLPWRRKPSGPVGLGGTLAAPQAPYEAGTIYMACDSSGYAGLVRLEDGRLDIAAAVYEPAGNERRRTAADRIDSILSAAGMPPVSGLDAVRWRGTPRLHRQRHPGVGRVVAIGDAAGYVEPFTGEGMAWGMQTGMLAARLIAQAMEPNASLPQAADLGSLYTRAYHQLLARRRLPCRLLAAALRPTMTRRMLFRTLSAAPWLARPVVRMVNRPGISAPVKSPFE